MTTNFTKTDLAAVRDALRAASPIERCVSIPGGWERLCVLPVSPRKGKCASEEYWSPDTRAILQHRMKRRNIECCKNLTSWEELEAYLADL